LLGGGVVGWLKGRAGGVWAGTSLQVLQPSEQVVGVGTATLWLPLVGGGNRWGVGVDWRLSLVGRAAPVGGLVCGRFGLPVGSWDVTIGGPQQTLQRCR
jgi:hypothetical protein